MVGQDREIRLIERSRYLVSAVSLVGGGAALWLRHAIREAAMLPDARHGIRSCQYNPTTTMR